MPDRATDARLPEGIVVGGEDVTYTISVTNVGDAPTRGEVVVLDPLPGEIGFQPPTGDGWDCVQTPDLEINCRRSDSLAPGASYPDHRHHGHHPRRVHAALHPVPRFKELMKRPGTPGRVRRVDR